MKKVIFLLFIFPFLYIPAPVYGHAENSQPFFKINGEFVLTSPFQTGDVSPEAFSPPEDIAPQNYLVNQPIEFEIDTTQLDNVSSFSWDFGDNQKGEGVKNTHTYSKIGSYTLSITANYNTSDAPKLIESVQLNILPNRDYELPRPIIRINSIEVKEPLKASSNFDLNKKLTFDATTSHSSSRIIEYTWDFDDGQSSNEPITTHRYQLPRFYASPSLRIKNEDGFTAYTFADITNSGKNDPNNTQFEEFKESFLPIVTLLAGIIMLIGAVILLKRRR